MRTTLNLDPVVISAARAKAEAEQISLGEAVSALVEIGPTAVHAGNVQKSGFPVLTGVSEHQVTDELVATHRDEFQGEDPSAA